MDDGVKKIKALEGEVQRLKTEMRVIHILLSLIALYLLWNR